MRLKYFSLQLHLSKRPKRAFQEGVVPGTLKWSLVPPDFKECCLRRS
jgi:hypothetical protein